MARGRGVAALLTCGAFLSVTTPADSVRATSSPSSETKLLQLSLRPLRTAPDVDLLLQDHMCNCSTVFVSNFFTTRQDPQLKRSQEPRFDYFEKYFKSVLSMPGAKTKAVILYDALPEDIVTGLTAADGAVSFLRVNMSKFDKMLGLNDLRFQAFLSLLEEHPEWETVFFTDIADVTVHHNPCALVGQLPTKLFVGSEPSDMKSNAWLSWKFKEMGGKYWNWFARLPMHEMQVMNAGIVGGRRPVILEFLKKLTQVLEDPSIAVRQQGETVKVNMPALNYVVGTEYWPSGVVTGYPLQSVFKGYQNTTDVYFTHK